MKSQLCIRKAIKWCSAAMMPAVLALVVGSGLAGCKGPSYLAKYGPAYDTVRRSKGIAVVPAGWIVEDSSKYITWHRPNWDGKAGGYQHKDVSINSDGSIRQEQDVFYSGKSFKNVVEGSMQAEMVTMTYQYSPRVPGKYWTIDALIAPIGREATVDDAGGRVLTVEEADRLLESWGIKRIAPAPPGG